MSETGTGINDINIAVGQIYRKYYTDEEKRYISSKELKKRMCISKTATGQDGYWNCVWNDGEINTLHNSTIEEEYRLVAEYKNFLCAVRSQKFENNYYVPEKNILCIFNWQNDIIDGQYFKCENEELYKIKNQIVTLLDKKKDPLYTEPFFDYIVAFDYENTGSESSKQYCIKDTIGMNTHWTMPITVSATLYRDNYDSTLPKQFDVLQRLLDEEIIEDIGCVQQVQIVGINNNEIGLPNNITDCADETKLKHPDIDVVLDLNCIMNSQLMEEE